MNDAHNTKQAILDTYVKLVKQNKSHPTVGDFAREGITRDKIRYWFYTMTELKNYVSKQFPKVLHDVTKPEISDVKKTIIDKYITLSKSLKIFPSGVELRDIGISKDSVKHYFGSLSALKDYILKNHISEVKDVFDEKSFIKRNIKTLDSKLTKYSRFVITSIVGGGSIDTNFYENLKFYCKENKAALLIEICEDPASTRKFRVPEELVGEQFIFTDTQLNSNIFISSIKLSAKHIDPITGLSRIGQRNGSFLYASPKQRLFFAPTGNSKLPHAIFTTGAITIPDYETERYMSERTAYLAKNDHIIGAVIVEIEDDELFHFRHLQADYNGGFVDLGVQYKDKKLSESRPEEFILGDWHSGETDESVKTALKEIIDQVKPKGLVLHDVFDGKSINHHEKKKKITRIKIFRENKLSLEQEIKFLVKDLEELSTWVERITIVKSNHDEFLEELLEDGRWINDPVNGEICSKLTTAMIEGLNPLKYACELYGLTANNIRWLERDEDYIVAGCQCGAHGDKGPNGSRGSLRNLEAAYGNCIIGHSHTPGTIRQASQVGTSSHLKLNYNKGASSWFHTSCLLYKTGARQLINIVDGKWKL